MRIPQENGENSGWHYKYYCLSYGCGQPCSFFLELNMNAAIARSPLDTNGIFYAGFRKKVRDGTPIYGPDEQAVIQGTVDELIGSDTSTKPGMLLGKIQSGKTKTFLGIVALAFDNGFDIAIILTKPTTALAKQTYKRVSKEFAEFIECDNAKVYDILEIPSRLTKFELHQKLIFVVKKQTDNLTRIYEALFTTYPELSGKRVLIIDDEADNASIGYSNNKDTGIQLRTIADQVDNFRHKLRLSSFLQVTATPYSLYLQPEDEPIPGASLMPVRPSFTKLVPVHNDYVGGDFYFEDARLQTHPAYYVFSPVAHDELTVLKNDDRRRFKVEDCLTSPKISGLRKAILNFVTAGAIRRIQAEQKHDRTKRFAFLFHTEAGRAAHAWQESVVLRFDEELKKAAENKSVLLKSLVRESYEDLSRSILAAALFLPTFDDVLERVRLALSDGELMITKVNSEAQVASLLDDDGQLKLRTPLNIFIGGQILDRGITIANLIGFYYGRDPKKFQQDTVLQHSRMYGFRPPEDRAITRFYTAMHIHRAMGRMHEADSALRERIASKGDDQTVNFIELHSGNIIPCSPAKVLASNITTIQGHRRILPIGFQTDYKIRLQSITNAVDAKLRKLGSFPNDGDAPPPYEIALDEACAVLDLISPTFTEFEPGYEDTWDVEEYKGILQHLVGKSNNMYVLLRTGRNISRFLNIDTNTFSHAPDNGKIDLDVAKKFARTVPVLMLLRQNGAEAQSWRGHPFWWPVILVQEQARTTLFAHSR
jgi:Z1 domain